jgi:hypothetical protein
MKALEKDGVIDHDAIETKARVVALEAIVSWQTSRLEVCLSLLPSDVKALALKEMEGSIERAVVEYRNVLFPDMSAMDSDYLNELIQEVFLEYVREIQKTLGIPS